MVMEKNDRERGGGGGGGGVGGGGGGRIYSKKFLKSFLLIAKHI